MIRPQPCLIMCGAAYLMHRKALFRWFPSMKSQSSSGISTRVLLYWGPVVPALFTRMSSRPKVLMVVSTSRCTSAACVTSACTATARDPLSSSLRTTCSASATLLAVATTTAAPSAASASASARPIPLLPPVTMATRSFNPRSMTSSSNAK